MVSFISAYKIMCDFLLLMKIEGECPVTMMCNPIDCGIIINTMRYAAENSSDACKDTIR